MNNSKSDSPAVSSFKGNVKDMQEYLASVGHAIQISHLLEAVSRYEHQKNWQTQRGILSKPKQFTKLDVQNSWHIPVPDLKGRIFEVRIAGSSSTGFDELYGDILLDVDQKWVEHLIEMSFMAKTKKLTFTENENLDFDGFDQVTINNEEINIYSESFVLSGYTKYDGTHINSELIDIVEFLGQVVGAIDGNFSSEKLSITAK